MKRRNPNIAYAYLSFRIVEVTILIAGLLGPLLLIPLSKEFLRPGEGDAPWYQAMGSMAVQAKFLAFQISMLFTAAGGLLLCMSLYASSLIPRLISALGLLGYALLLASVILDLPGMVDMKGAGMALYIPGGLFELLVFPLYLICRGFNPAENSEGKV